MADRRIIDLTAQVTPNDTDLYENSLNGAGSQKETRLQMRTALQTTFDTRYAFTGAGITPNYVLKNISAGVNGWFYEGQQSQAGSTQGANALSFGLGAAVTNQGSGAIAIGNAASPANQGANSIAIGSNSIANNVNAVVMGNQAGAGGINSMALGPSAKTGNPNGIAIGNHAGNLIQGAGSIALGLQAGANTPQDINAIAIGNSAALDGQAAQAIAIGLDAGSSNQGQSAIAIGVAAGATNQPTESIAIGDTAATGSAGNVAIGSHSTANFSNSIALGMNATTTAINQAILPTGIRWSPASLGSTPTNTTFLRGDGVYAIPPTAGVDNFNFIYQLNLSWLSNTTISISAGQCIDSSNTTNMINGAPITLDVAASGANGLDTGTFTFGPFNMYKIFLISDSTSVNPVATLASLYIYDGNLGPSVLPAGYDTYRLIGWINCTASNFIRTFRQTGIYNTRNYYYDQGHFVLNGGSSTGYFAIELGSIPRICPVYMGGVYIGATPGNFLSIRATGSTGTGPGGSVIFEICQAALIGVAINNKRIICGVTGINNVPSVQYLVSNASDTVSLIVNGFDDYI